MKLSKKIRNAIFVAMSFAMIGSLTLTGCSDGSDNDDSKNETAKDETTYVKKFDITKNTYAETPQVQVKIDTGIDTFMVGDKITVHMKGVASKKFAAELYIVDTSEAANYWSSLAIKSADDDGKEVLDINTEFNITKTFEITSTNKGKVSDVKFAINGTDGDETIKIKCTEFSIARDGIIKVEKVELNKTSATPTVGDTIELTATVTPDNATDKTVTWDSSDKTVATVENGKVTTLKKGTSKITAKAGDVEAVCEITVLEKGEEVVAVTGVELEASKSIKIGEDATLTAKISPENATNKAVTWKSDKEEIAKVDATGKVTAVAPGTATITVTTDDGKKTAECKITVPVTYNLENGVIFGTFNNWSGETAPKFSKNSDGTYSATIGITADITEFEAKIANSDWSIKIGGGVTISVGGSEQQAALAPTDDDPAIKITGVAKLDELKVTITDDLKIKIEKTGTITPSSDDTPAAALELDFTTVGESSITDKFDVVTWDSVSEESKGSITAEGLELTVNKSWDGAFKAAINSTDLSAVTKIAVEFKVSDDWTYGGSTNNKCNIMLISEEDSSYKAVKVDLGDFAQQDATNTSFTTAEITNIYPKTWEECSAADRTKIIAIKINTMDGVGKITIKSIKFYN